MADGYFIYRLDEVEVDTLAGCVRRSGAEEPLRQKSFQVLVFLIQNRGRLVTKDEIMKALWPDVVVTEDALVQSIVEVRRLLRDDARSPRFVKTVPKLGYRFVGNVEEVLAGGPASIVTYEEETTFRVEVEEVRSVLPPSDPGVAAPLLAAATAAATATTAAAPSRRTSRRSWGIAALALVALAGVGLAVAQRTFGPAAEARQDVPVAVLPFENRSGAADLEWLRYGLADMLVTELARRPGLVVLTSAQASKSGILVSGTFTSLGGSIRVDARLSDAATGRLLGAEAITVARPESLLTEVGPLAHRLGSRLGARPPSASARPIEEAMTRSLPAYRAYSLALERAEALRSQEAVELLEEAIRLDPSFAMAHARLGYVYAFSWGRVATARPYLEKAWALSEGLTERNRLSIAAWYAMANGDYEGAIRGYRELLASAPDDVESLVRLGHLLRGEERHEEAVNVLRRALAFAPHSADAANRLSGTLMEMGRHEEAIEMAARYVSLSPEEPNAHDSLGLALAWAGRHAEALAAYDRALALRPDFEIARVHRGNTYVWLGRYREARGDYETYLSHARSSLETGRAHASLSALHRRLGDRERARAAARAAREAEPESVWEAFLVAIEESDVRTVSELRDAVLRPSTTYTERGARASRRPQEVARGRLALLEGRTEDALTAMRQALAHRPLIFNVEPLEDCLAEALLALGRHAEAADELRRLLSRNPNDALSRYRLGIALGALGERESSRAELRSFLSLWEGADADAPALVDARARLGLSASPSTSPSGRRAPAGRAP